MTKEDETNIWQKLLSCRRVNDLIDGKVETECKTEPRNPFQRDCDRITYSYPFRRLQDKTQVIPVPVIDFVHSRLTHTLEVTTVGRSLGALLENYLIGKGVIKISDKGSIPSILTAACLSHDIGNPPFGHSGEDAISEFFKFGKGLELLEETYRGKEIDPDGKFYEMVISTVTSECKMRDLQHFEGNAMGFRLLTKYDDRGLNLTCATLAAFTKYPRQSYIDGEVNPEIRWDENRVSQKKYGFFQSELEIFKIVANEVGLKALKSDSDGNYAWARHPLAFLMEAADDICYRIIDLEDGYRIGRIPFSEAASLLTSIAKKDERYSLAEYSNIKTEKQKFSYLRSRCINLLIHKAFEVFIDNYNKILEFEFDQDLIKRIDSDLVSALGELKEIVKKYVYKWSDILSLEAAGFEVLGGLLEQFISASNICLMCPEHTRSKRASKIFNLLPVEYQHTDSEEIYNRYLKIASYVSGGTDSYTLNVYQRIKGIKI